MNNKEFVKAMAETLNTDANDVREKAAGLAGALASTLDDTTILSVKGFGTFEVRKRIERVAMNPATRQKVLVPPKLSLLFRASPALKERIWPKTKR